jgi:hypothetical protein
MQPKEHFQLHGQLQLWFPPLHHACCICHMYSIGLEWDHSAVENNQCAFVPAFFPLIDNVGE